MFFLSYWFSVSFQLLSCSFCAAVRSKLSLATLVLCWAGRKRDCSGATNVEFGIANGMRNCKWNEEARQYSREQ